MENLNSLDFIVLKSKFPYKIISEELKTVLLRLPINLCHPDPV